MLHGRVVRPPYAGVDAGDFVGTSLIAVDEILGRATSRARRGGRDRRFRRRRRRARGARDQGGCAARGRMEADAEPCPISTISKPRCAPIRRHRATLLDKGDVDGALAGAAKPMPRTYVWPYQMHASIGPSCAVADYADEASGSGPAPRTRICCAPISRGCWHCRKTQIDVIRHGSGRLLWPQLRRRCRRRRGAAVARGRPPGARAAHARAGARVGAEGHRATDGGQWRV